MPVIESDYGGVTLLIGADNQRDAHTQLAWHHPPDGLVAPSGIQTPLGWCIAGPVPEESCVSFCVLVTNLQKDVDENLSRRVEDFWLTDSFPLFPSVKPLLSKEDKSAIETVSRSITYDQGKYSVGLPWKNRDIVLPDNFELAFKRLKALQHRFKRDDPFKVQYKAVVENYITQGYAKRINDVSSSSARTWYLSHHGVSNPKKPEMLRVVS